MQHHLLLIKQLIMLMYECMDGGMDGLTGSCLSFIVVTAVTPYNDKKKKKTEGDSRIQDSNALSLTFNYPEFNHKLLLGNYRLLHQNMSKISMGFPPPNEGNK